VLPENKLLFNPDNILFVFRIVFLQLFKQLSFDQSLFKKSLFVSEYFESAELFQLMIEAFEYLSKRAFTLSFGNLETVSYLVSNFAYILTFVIVKAIIIDPIGTHNSFLIVNVQVKDLVIFKDLCSFYIK
jgi:hypothetical protein